jgi:hypothetical protein
MSSGISKLIIGSTAQSSNPRASLRDPNMKGSGTGHVGIVDYDGSWIGAGGKDVNRKADIQDEYSLRKNGVSYQKAVFRKFQP